MLDWQKFASDTEVQSEVRQCDRLIVSTRSGKLSFHDWKNQREVGEFCYRRPVGTLQMLNVQCAIFRVHDMH